MWKYFKPAPNGYLFTNKSLISLLIPMTIEQFLLILVGTCDQMMVTSLGKVCVSAVSVAGQLNLFLHSIYSALGVGGAIVVAHALGAGSNERAKSATRQLLQCVFVIATLTMIVVLLFMDPLLHLIYGEIEPEMKEEMVKYLWVSAISYPISAVRWSAAGVFRVIKKASYSMYCAVIANIVNVILNAIFIFSFGWGVRGAALATLCSLSVSAVIMLSLLSQSRFVIQFKIFDRPQFDWEAVKKILYFGVPSGLESGLFQLGRVLVQSVLIVYGSIQVAAYSVTLTVGHICLLVVSGFYTCVVTVIGQVTGTRDKVQTRYYFKKLLAWSMVFNFVWIVLTAAFLPLLLKYYGRHLPAETMTYAKYAIAAYLPLEIILWPAAFIVGAMLRAMNDVKFVMIVSVASMFIFRVGSCYWLSNVLHNGVWAVMIAMFMDWIVRAGFFLWRYRSSRWFRYFYSKKLKG